MFTDSSFEKSKIKLSPTDVPTFPPRINVLMRELSVVELLVYLWLKKVQSFDSIPQKSCAKDNKRERDGWGQY